MPPPAHPQTESSDTPEAKKWYESGWYFGLVGLLILVVNGIWLGPFIGIDWIAGAIIIGFVFIFLIVIPMYFETKDKLATDTVDRKKIFQFLIPQKGVPLISYPDYLTFAVIGIGGYIASLFSRKHHWFGLSSSTGFMAYVAVLLAVWGLFSLYLKLAKKKYGDDYQNPNL